MKSNGKNLKMFKYSHHDYMDMYPEWSFATWKDQETADKCINGMREMYNSGTVSNAVEVSPMEFFQDRQSKYWRGYEEALDNAALDCPQEWVDEYSFYVEHKDWDTAALRNAWNEQI